MNGKPPKHTQRQKPPSPSDEDLEQRVKELKKKLQQERKEKEDLKDKMKIEVKDREDKIEELKYRLEELEKSKKKKQDKISSEIQEERDELKEENKELIMENEELEEKNDELEDKIELLENKLDELRNEKRMLEKKLEKYEEDKNLGFHLPSNAEIRGDIESEDPIRVENGVKILGSLKSDDDIILGHGNEIKGDIISKNGTVKVGNGSEIGGLIKGREVRLAEAVKSGEIRADERMFVGKDCRVEDLFALGDVELGENVMIDGSLEYTGNFDASKGVEITKNVKPRSKDELDERANNLLSTTPAFPPVIVRGETTPSDLIISEEKFGYKSIEKKIDIIRKMVKISREHDLNIDKEREFLSEGASLYKKEEAEEADEILTEAYFRLKEKLSDVIDKSEKGDIKEELNGIATVDDHFSLSSMLESQGASSQREEMDEEEIEETEETKEQVEEDKKEVIEELSQIDGVGNSVALKLYEGGFDSIEDIKEKSQGELEKVEGIGKSLSKKIKENVKKL